MKKMNLEEFHKRVAEVNKAARIFAPLTNNVTDAFRIYQEVLAEEKMEVFISSVMGRRPLTQLDAFVRPSCPECESDMMIRTVPMNDEGVVTQLVCSNDSCDVVLDSKLTLEGWMEVLEKK